MGILRYYSPYSIIGRFSEDNLDNALSFIYFQTYINALSNFWSENLHQTF